MDTTLEINAALAEIDIRNGVHAARARCATLKAQDQTDVVKRMSKPRSFASKSERRRRAST